MAHERRRAMKIKHWQGYGSIEAKKIKKQTKGGVTDIVIKLSGNHECGLERKDDYDIARWLLPYFDKKEFPKGTANYRKIIDMTLTPGYENGVETCEYAIQYEPTEA